MVCSPKGQASAPPEHKSAKDRETLARSIASAADMVDLCLPVFV
jgi:hypothetical protein